MSTLLSDKGLMDDKVAGMDKRVRMSLRQQICSYIWLFNVRYYECPSVISFETNVDDASTSTLGIDSSY